MKLKTAPNKAAAATAAAPGGATIADRFKLDAPAGGAKKSGGTVNRTAALVALIAAVIGLGLSGMLTYILYSHWEYLMPA